MASPFSSVYAQDSTAAAAPAADAGKLTISGYLDSYYITNFNHPQSGNSMGYGANYGTANGTGYARAFDRLTDQFALGLVQTKFAYSNAKSDMVIDLTFGPNAELGNFGNQRFNGTAAGGYVTGFAPSNGNQQALYGTGAAIKQAYFTYKFTDKWNFTIGQFGTHIGYEVIDAPVNYHYSLSNLFNNGPFYHVGAKTQYMFSPKFGLMGGVVNNWDAMTDWKTQKSVIGQLFVSPVEGMNIYVNYIGGYHDDGFKVYNNLPGTKVSNAAYPNGGGRGYIRQMLDLTAGYQITDKLYFGINAALGWYAWQIDTKTEEFNKNGGSASGTIGANTDSTSVMGVDPDGNGKNNISYGNKAWGSSIFGDSSRFQTWGGIALYANYKLNDMFGIGLRYEHFDDRNGLRYLGGVNNALTITMPITLADGHLIIKPEFRFDEGVLGYAAAGLDPNAKDTDGKKYTTGGGLYEARGKDGNGNAVPKGVAQTSGQSTIGLAFIYKY
ncbi:MAG: outer membrane beta-barrel protein [Opitutaceae bacterium]|nr:outer membrane beta-barrel protein [Cytophagales bacterium]